MSQLRSDLADQSVQFGAWTTLTGAAVTVTSATAGLSLWYRRGVTGVKTAISPSNLAFLTTAHTDGGILVIEGAEHRLDLPDAATASGVDSVSWGGTATGITIDGGEANLVTGIKRGVALANLTFLMTLDRTPITGLTIAGTVKKDDGAFSGVSGSITEVGNGVYMLSTITATEMTASIVTLRFTATGADDLTITIPLGT